MQGETKTATVPAARRAAAVAPDVGGGQDGAPGRLFHPAESPPGAWQALAATLFRERMLDSERLFPCVFGVDAVRKGTLRFAFIPVGPARIEALAEALGEFGTVAESLGNRTSLVCFFEHDPTLVTVEDFKRHFWSLLQGVHDVDDADWPADVATDPENPSWEYSFRGVPLFVVANTPAHRKRHSRYFEYFAVTFQPRFVFDGLAADTLQGRNARRIIRQRLRSYDDVPVTAHLGNFGDPHNREWIQYFLEDDETAADPAARCPVQIRLPSQQHSKETLRMTTPRFDTASAPSLPHRLSALLPLQGSLELQHDQPGKTHSWHVHNLDEELFVLEGEVTLFWSADGSTSQRICPAGTWISLPAGTVHGSTAGALGAVYMIRPEGGGTAETTFLAPEQFPAP